MKQINAYLIFDGNCREAMTFYEKSLGAELHMMPFSDMPAGEKGPSMGAEAKDRVMHARLSKGGGVLMASDTMPGIPFQQGNNVSISVDCEDLAEIERYFAAFSEGGNIKMPLQDTFWGARFGMLTDKFGIHWMFNFDKPK